jgi:hypothetical protein
MSKREKLAIRFIIVIQVPINTYVSQHCLYCQQGMLFESMVLGGNKRRGSSMLLVYTVTKGIAIIFSFWHFSVTSVSRLVCTDA